VSHNQLVVVDIVIGILTYILIYYTLSQFLSLKVRLWKPLVAVIFVYLLHYFTMIFFVDDYVRYTGNIVVFHVFAIAMIVPELIIVLCAFRGSILKKMGICILFHMVFGLCAAIALVLFRVVLSDIPVIIDPELLNFNLTPEHMYGVFVGFLLMVLISGLAIWVGRATKQRRLNLIFLLFPLLPMGQMIILIGVAGTGFIYIWWAYIGLLLCFISNIVLLIVLLEQDKKMLLRDELTELQHMRELEQLHYAGVGQRRQELTKIRHDFNNQLAAAHQLITTDKKDHAQKLLDELKQSIVDTEEYQYCQNAIVNAVIMEKQKECDTANIRLETDVTIDENCNITQTHLCSIFTNLLDNAIRACKHIPQEQRLIELRTAAKGDYLHIKCVNPVAAHKLPQSQPKKNRDGKGYGKIILADIAEHYSGNFTAEIIDDRHIAVVSVLAVPLTQS